MAEFYTLDWGTRLHSAFALSAQHYSKKDKKTLIRDLRLFAETKPGLVDQRTDNEFLERFLKARKYVFDDSCDLYVNYYLFKQRNPDVFNRLSGQDVLVQQALRDGFPGVLEKRDRILKLMIEGLQDCFPAKFKGVHFINQPWYVEVALTLIRPFLKEKSKERIYLHGNNLSTLHQYLAKDILPSELGGEWAPFNPLPWAEKLMSQTLE